MTGIMEMVFVKRSDPPRVEVYLHEFDNVRDEGIELPTIYGVTEDEALGLAVWKYVDWINNQVIKLTVGSG